MNKMNVGIGVLECIVLNLLNIGLKPNNDRYFKYYGNEINTLTEIFTYANQFN